MELCLAVHGWDRGGGQQGPILAANCICKQGQDLLGKPCKVTDMREVCIVLGSAAKNAGLSLSTMETHGLAQRGGVVVSDLAIGYDPRESPICSNGEADVLIALETLESLRSLPRLRKNGIVVVNTTQYQPLTVRISKGEVKYPTIDEIRAELAKWTPNILFVEANQDASSLGLSQAMNVILLGALAGNTDILPFSQEDIKKIQLIKIVQNTSNR